VLRKSLSAVREKRRADPPGGGRGKGRREGFRKVGAKKDPGARASRSYGYASLWTLLGALRHSASKTRSLGSKRIFSSVAWPCGL